MILQKRSPKSNHRANQKDRRSFLTPWIIARTDSPVLRLISLLLAVALLIPPALTLAGEPGQVALVIQFDDGRQETRCIPIEGDDIAGDDIGDDTFTGADLLDRSGLRIVVDASSGMGITVCQVEELGCAFPAVDCFCQCMTGSECGYWNYYYRDPVEGGGSADWIYSPFGAKLRKLQPGTIEAWVWGDGASPPSDDLTFEAVCGLPAEPPTVTPESADQPALPAPTAPATESAAAAANDPTEEPAPATQLAPTAFATQPAGAETTAPAPTTGNAGAGSTLSSQMTESPGPNLASYWPFGLMILILAAVGIVVRRRRF